MARARVTISIEEELLEWVDGRAAERRYKDRSHFIESALADYRELLRGGEIDAPAEGGGTMRLKGEKI